MGLFYITFIIQLFSAIEAFCLIVIVEHGSGLICRLRDVFSIL